jgi:hypothetical protein
MRFKPRPKLGLNRIVMSKSVKPTMGLPIKRSFPGIFAGDDHASVIPDLGGSPDHRIPPRYRIGEVSDRGSDSLFFRIVTLEQSQPLKATKGSKEKEVAEAAEPDDRGIKMNQVEGLLLSRGNKVRLAMLHNRNGIALGLHRRRFLINDPDGHVHPDDRHRQHGDKAESGNGAE